jgi:succinate dehydrogenase/fumarate reductase flavoprotein subunit
MNFEELDEIIRKETELSICKVCGTPFTPYHSRQKTCGAEECKRIWNAKRVNNYRKKKSEESPEEWRMKRRTATTRYRAKKRAAEKHEEKLQEIEEHWKEFEEHEDRITGLDYGKRQMERTLALVPKINIDLGGKEK